MRILAACLLMLFAAVGTLPAAASYEWIASFNSDITIEPDGDLIVTETIEVVAGGDQIRRGIIRSFPTDYVDDWGMAHIVRFEVQSVRRDGRPEPFEVDRVDGGREIRIGSPDVLLPEGRHVYEIRYVTNRQIGFFDGHDELYWNVTGNEWWFAITKAQATIHLPGGAKATDLKVYTGRRGENGTDAAIQAVAPGTIAASTTADLAVGEGLTVVVAFPKGFVAEPSLVTRSANLLWDNPAIPFSLLGLLAILAHYAYGRWRYGTNAPAGDVIPLFEPPTGMGPGDARMLDRFRFDQTGFAAIILDLAAQGFIAIERDGPEGETTLRRLDGKTDATGLPPASQKVLQTLFKKKRRRFSFSRGNGPTTIEAYAAANKALEVAHVPAHIKRNADRSVGCTAIVILAALALVFTAAGWINWLVAITAWVVMIVIGFMGEELMAISTKAGQKHRDALEGLKLYLGTAEQDRWAALHPPELTLERFERLFPYALALGVEQPWSEAFARQIALSGAEAADYKPSFYSGPNFSLSGITSFSASLSSSMSAPSVQGSGSVPGSSSGLTSSYSGGGGFSGGGGGGGGGRGW